MLASPYDPTPKRHGRTRVVINHWVVGADPGGRETGLVLCAGKQVLEREVVVRTTKGLLADTAYLNKVIDRIHHYRSVAGDDHPLLAVEGLVEPNPHLGLTKVIPLIATGMVLGAILAVYPDAVVVRPGGHGSRFVTAYPEELRPTRGQGKGMDRLRHTRSAYDIAHAGRIVARQNGAR